MKTPKKKPKKMLVAQGCVVIGKVNLGKQVGKPLKGKVVIPWCKTCG